MCIVSSDIPLSAILSPNITHCSRETTPQQAFHLHPSVRNVSHHSERCKYSPPQQTGSKRTYQLGCTNSLKGHLATPTRIDMSSTVSSTEAWHEMRAYLAEQRRQANEVVIALVPSANARATGMPVNSVDDTELERAEQWLFEKRDDENFDGEDSVSKKVKNSLLFKIVREEANPQAAADDEVEDGDQRDVQDSGDFEDDDDFVPDEHIVEQEEDDVDFDHDGSDEEAYDDDLSSGDSQDSSDDNSRSAPGSGRGNRNPDSHKAPDYSQDEKKQLILLYGKWFGQKVPRGLDKKARRALNKWLREQGIMTPWQQNKPLKRGYVGVRQQRQKLWKEGWTLVDGMPIAPSLKVDLPGTTRQDRG